jgi:TATA-box binding protein (TBP) (component of TFIID and TFIIIB)
MDNLRISTITSIGQISTSFKILNAFNNINPNEFITYLEYEGGRKGYAKKNDKKKRKITNKRCLFFNMMSFILNFEDKLITIKLFTNEMSKFQITGGRDEEQGKRAMNKLINYILDLDINFCDDQKIFTNRDVSITDYKIVLINSDIDIKKQINREELFEVADEAGYFVSYSPDSYPACSIKYYYNEKFDNNGICECENTCDGKGCGCGDGNCKKITIAAFSSGKILLTGAQNSKQLQSSYNFINKFIDYNKDRVIMR